MRTPPEATDRAPSAARPLDAATRLAESVAHAVEELHAVDGLARRLQQTARDLLGHGGVRDAMTGRQLGHAVHPVLTDLPIGFWTSAFTLDLLGGRRSRAAAQRLVAWGILCALPTAATGAADWSDTTGPARRVGLVHASLNSAALACFTASWLARRRGRQGRGVLYGLLGSAVATGAGYFGGHLVQRLGIGVDHTVFEALPAGWTPTRPVSEWSDGEPRRVGAAGTDVVVVRHHDTWSALAARCSHAGGPLDEGTVHEGCIECPWHASRFRLDDGTVARGPAFAPQPVVEVRVRDEVVEVRAASG